MKQEFCDDVWDVVCDMVQMGHAASWADEAEIHRVGGFIRLREEGERRDLFMRRGELEAGLRRLFNACEDIKGRLGDDPLDWWTFTALAIFTQDACDFDSISADMLVQLMTLGEIAYE